MAATMPKLTATEQAEHSIIQTLQSLATAQRDVDHLSPELAFDVGCVLTNARIALDRALVIITQTQPQTRRLAA